MSHHRELTRAQQELNAAAREFVLAESDFAESGAEDRWLDAIAALVDQYNVFEELTFQTEAEGAASARPTSIAASKNLSAVSTWRGKVQRAVYAAGLVRQGVNDPTYWGGATCDELERKLGSYGHAAHHGSISSACNWAEKAGWIKDSGFTRETRGGQQAIVYEPTQKLIDKIAEERRVA
jgi:hypothetical protein